MMYGMFLYIKIKVNHKRRPAIKIAGLLFFLYYFWKKRKNFKKRKNIAKNEK